MSACTNTSIDLTFELPLQLSFEVSLDANRELVGQEIVDKFLKSDSVQRVEVVNEQLIERSISNLSAKSRDLFVDCAK